MKRQLCLVLILVVLMSSLMVVTGCHSRDEALVGAWSWREIEEFGQSFVITLNEDGSGSMNIFGESTPLTNWRTSGDELRIEYMEDGQRAFETFGYSFNGDILELYFRQTAATMTEEDLAIFEEIGFTFHNIR